LLALIFYLLIGRFFHDAILREEISYRLTESGLEVWRRGGTSPECTIELHRLVDLNPRFVTASGRGTVELPPGG
jgi:hypothetical protein